MHKRGPIPLCFCPRVNGGPLMERMSMKNGLAFGASLLLALLIFTGCPVPGGGTSTVAGNSPTVTLAGQTGAITSGTAGAATFAVTTADVSAGTTGVFTWYTSMAGTATTTAPTGIAPSVTAVTGNAAVITMAADATAVAGSYYFKLAEGSAVSAVATVTVISAGTPTVTLAGQTGTLTSGTAGTATFAVTTADVSAGTTGTFTWYTSTAGSATTTAPTGITPSVAAVNGNAAVITIAADATSVAGSYSFKLAEGSAISAVATVTVTSPGTPTVTLAGQTGTIISGTAGAATFAVSTANVSAGTTVMNTPSVVSRNEKVKASSGRVDPIQANRIGRRSTSGWKWTRKVSRTMELMPSAATIRSACVRPPSSK